MLYVFEKMLEKFALRIGYSALRDLGTQTSNWHGIEVVGEPKDCSKVISALEWVEACAVDAKETITENLKSIMCAEISAPGILPVLRTVVFDSRWIGRSDTKRIANRLVQAGHYVKECIATGKYRAGKLY